MKSLKHLWRVIAAVGVVLISGHALAMGSLADVEIVDRATGRALPIHMHKGEAWVAGTPGAKYSIRVRSQYWGRMLAVMSVDGVNVLSGESASGEQTGYVYGRFDHGDIAGWRKSDNEIAAFEFVASPRSYAQRTGRPQNVGVIGVALFREKVSLRRKDFAPASPVAPFSSPSPLTESDAAARAAPSAKMQSQSQSAPIGASGLAYEPEKKLGTGHGEREHSPIERTHFTRESNVANEVISIRYDSRENLLAMGVITERYAGRNPAPNPFPLNQYVPDPPSFFPMR